MKNKKTLVQMNMIVSITSWWKHSKI